MTTVLYAQPYDISASGFYFRDADEYAVKAAKARNDFGQPVEEFEIQFIDGEDIDAALARAVDLSQANALRFFEIVEEWDEWQKRQVILAVGECGYDFDLHADTPDNLDVDIYEMNSLRELAEHFVDEGLFGEIPEHLAGYLDYDAIARDLGMDYVETEVAGTRLIYRCG
ncbi:MAG: antirestriction protein ArdA [Neomegalonema sp.]|nr:antirestriction protein ArdA [Neomegalonema sp.]